MVHPEDDLVVISDKGLVIRMFADDIPQMGRPAQGVAVMNMRDGDRWPPWPASPATATTPASFRPTWTVCSRPRRTPPARRGRTATVN